MAFFCRSEKGSAVVTLLELGDGLFDLAAGIGVDLDRGPAFPAVDFSDQRLADDFKHGQIHPRKEYRQRGPKMILNRWLLLRLALVPLAVLWHL